MRRTRILLYIACLWVFLLTPVAHADGNTYYPTGDTQVTAGFIAEDMNWGDDDAMMVGRLDATYLDQVRCLVKFDLSEIPSQASIVSAKLRLYHYAHAGGSPDFTSADVSVHRLGADWQESTATWKNMSGAWGTRTYATQSLGLSRVETWVEWDVTALVREWHNRTYPNYGFGLRGDESARNTKKTKAFRTKERGTTYRPRLVVEWTTPTATPTKTAIGTPVSTGTPTPTTTNTVTPTETHTPTPTQTPASEAPYIFLPLLLRDTATTPAASPLGSQARQAGIRSCMGEIQQQHTEE